MGEQVERTALDFALEKTASIMGYVDGLNKTRINKINNLAGTATKGLLLGWALQSKIKSLMNDHAAKAMLEDLILTDPILKQADPERVKEFYATICYMAPKLKADKNIVRELLQNFVKFDRVDMASIKALADTQGVMSKGDKDMVGNIMKAFG